MLPKMVGGIRYYSYVLYKRNSGFISINMVRVIFLPLSQFYGTIMQRKEKERAVLEEMLTQEFFSRFIIELITSL